MSSIPLPALDLKTPQQPDLMSQYGNLLRLKSLQQQQALAPLQQQEAQQAVQSGQLQIQQQQREAASQQVIMDAYSNSNGDLSKAYDTAAKSGKALPGDLIKLRQAQIQTKAQAIDLLTKQGAKAIQDADLYSGAADTVNKAPSDQRPAVYQQARTNLANAGVDVSQLPPQYPGDQQFQVMRLGVQSHKNALDEAAKEADTAKATAQAAEANSGAAKSQAETSYYQQNGGAPGVPVESMELNSYLHNNPGKTPQDFAAWKARQSPTAMIMGNMLGGQQNSDALDFAANNYRQTGQMPPGLYRSPGTIQAIIGRAAQLDQQNGGSGIAANKATYQANEGSLKKLQTNYDQVQAFEQTASKNMDLLQQTAQKIPDLGSRFANVPVRMLNSRMLGTENMAAFNTALNTAQTEAAKVLNSSNASGVLSDSSRHELQQIIDGNMSYKAMTASLNTLKQDMANRTQSYQMQIGDIQGRIKGAGSPQASQMNGPAVGTVKTFPNGKTGKWDGQGWVAQ